MKMFALFSVVFICSTASQKEIDFAQIRTAALAINHQENPNICAVLVLNNLANSWAEEKGAELAKSSSPEARAQFFNKRYNH